MPTLDFSDVMFWASTTGAQIAIGVISFRRSYCLSRYPVWKSVLVGILAGWFAPIWLLNWAVNRKQVAEEWTRYRESRQHTPADVLQ